MFLLLSKILDLAAAPLTWAVVLGLLALLWQQSRPGRARLALAAALLLLVGLSVEPVSRRLMRGLERRAHDTFRPEPPYDVVVVLGGMIDPAATRASGQLEVNEAFDRLLRAAAVVRDGQAGHLLISGGSINPREGEPAEAEALAAWLRGQGMPADRIAVEPRSRNTRENALESAAVAGSRKWKRILLVTSAWHAPRALGCFRAAGLDPDLLTVDHRSGTVEKLYWLPRASALSMSTDALREYLGLLVYWVMGYTR